MRFLISIRNLRLLTFSVESRLLDYSTRRPRWSKSTLGRLMASRLSNQPAQSMQK